MFGHHHGGRAWGSHHRREAASQEADFMPRGDQDGRGFGGERHGHGWGGRGGFGGGFGGGGWGRDGRRGGRPLDQGDLRFILLDLIAEKPSHGYELIKAIEDAMDGHYAPSPGVVYPTLTLLEETGLISSETQGVKKLYSLTAEGGAYLDREAAALTAAKARLEEAKRRFGPPPAAEIGRAMGNLANALGLRVSKGPLSKEELRAVVDAIDAAARSVEQS